MTSHRRVFADICRGYSTFKRGKEIIYIKHLSHLDQIDMDDFNEEVLAQAKAKKLESEADKLIWLNKNNLWTEKEEKSLETLKKQRKNFQQTKANLFLPSDKQRMDILIKENDQKLAKLENQRRSLTGLTQEYYLESKNTVYYIYISLYKDSELKNRLYTKKEIEEIDDDELNYILQEYNKIMELFDEKGIRKVAVSDIFMAYFNNIGENTNNFFSKAISELSFHQLNLLFWGRYFRSLIQQSPNMPAEIKGDPDKMEDYVTGSQKTKQIISKGPKRAYGDGSGANFVGIVGTNEDMKQLGLK